MEMIKNSLSQRIGVYLKGKLVEIGPRGTLKIGEKDIESSPQLQELLARGDIRKVTVSGAEKPKTVDAIAKSKQKN